MAELPDIDTSNVSHIAYFNAIDDGGVTTIDPEEVTSAPGIQDYTLYDNGLEGTFNLQETYDDISLADSTVFPEATFRVKSDGWMVVYLDQYANFNRLVTGGDSRRWRRWSDERTRQRRDR